MDTLITIENKELRLNSGMSEAAFGKTNYDSIVTENGILAVCDSYENNSYHFKFENWSFSEIKSFDVPERLVFYCGKNPLPKGAKPLYEYFDGSSVSDQAYEAGYIVCSILTQAAKEGFALPVNGGGGILLLPQEEKTKVLFLPPNLYKYASVSLDPQSFVNQQGGWVNPTLFDLPAVCFERAAIAYKILTGNFAFSSIDNTERNADILDRNFLPVDLCVNGIDQNLAEQINKGLKLNSNAVEVPGKKKKGKSSEDLTPTADFPLASLYSEKNAPRSGKLSEQEFAEKAASYIKAKTAKVQTKRKIRRNRTAIIVCSITVIIVGLIINSAVQSDLGEYCSKGLDSTQTVEAYYKGYNTKDSMLLDNLTKGKKIKKAYGTIANIYVLGKQRQMYGNDNGYVRPEEYFYYARNYEGDKKTGIFGVTNVIIDGKLSNIDPKLYTQKDIIPAALENGRIPENKETTVHTAEYYLILSEGEYNDFEIEKIKDTLTLTWNKNRWLITELETIREPVTVDSNLFKAEYYKALDLTGDDVMEACKMMSLQYPWIPTEYALQKVKEYIAELINNPLSEFGL